MIEECDFYNCGRIKKIEEWSEESGLNPGERPCSYEGYKVTTTTCEIFVMIEDNTQCCENWGYFDKADNIEDYIGQKLLMIRADGRCMKLDELDDMNLHERECMFVDFVTERGVFQLAVYNAHNGYYNHDIVVRVNKRGKEYYLIDDYL